MVHYIRNLDLFEDYPRPLEDEDYDAEDYFASYKRYSVPHIDDIIFRMSYDADFYAILDPQLESAISLEDSGGCEFVVEPDIRNSAYDYPHEGVEIVDEDRYPPHPELDAVLARVASLQSAHRTNPDVPFDATAFQVANAYPIQDQEREMELRQTGDKGAWIGQNFNVRLSLLFPSESPHEKPVQKSDESKEPIYPRILDNPRRPSSSGKLG